MESIGKLTDIIVFVCMLFIIPVIWLSGKYNGLNYENMCNCVDRFLINSSESGYINSASYEAFIKQICYSDNHYDIELGYEEPVYMPDYENTGKNGIILMDYHDNYEIESEIINSGIYRFRYGGILTITVKQSIKSNNILNARNGYYRKTLRINGKGAKA